MHDLNLKRNSLQILPKILFCLASLSGMLFVLLFPLKGIFRSRNFELMNFIERYQHLVCFIYLQLFQLI